jgi:histidine triad (HIT) family protein
MASIFTKIIQGEIPCYKVAESADYFAFLDIQPRTKGHTLVVPKVEGDYIFDMEEEAYTGLLQFARKVAKAIEEAVPCERIGMAVIGLEVPHTHVHLVPLNAIGDLNFDHPAAELSPEEFEATAAAIRAKL